MVDLDIRLSKIVLSIAQFLESKKQAWLSQVLLGEQGTITMPGTKLRRRIYCISFDYYRVPQDPVPVDPRKR